MDIKQARTFVKIIDSESFTQAASSIGITKSAVSHMIDSLEKEIGAELFVRHGNEFVLTESGNAMYDAAKQMINDYESAIDTINGFKNEISGELKIGIGSFLEPYVRKAGLIMLEKHPKLLLRVYVYRSSTLNELLRAHKIDIAFTIRKSYDGEGIKSNPIVPVRVCAIMNKTHSLASKEKVTFEDLLHCSLAISDEDSRSIQTIGKIINKDVSLLRPRLSINTADGMLNAIEENGKLVAVCTPLHIVNRPNLIAKPIEDLEMDIMGYAHVMKDVYMKNSTRELCRLINEYAIPYYNAIQI